LETENLRPSIGSYVENHSSNEGTIKAIELIGQQIQRGEMQAATSQYKELNPNETTAQIEYKLALIGQRLGIKSRVLAHLASATAKDPDWLDPACALALHHMNEGRSKEAEALLIRHADRGWSSAIYQRTSARVLEATGNIESALRALQIANQIEPRDQETLSSLALLQRRAGRYEDALKTFTQQITNAPDNVQHALNAAATALIANRPELACQYYRHANEITPEKRPEWLYDYVEALRLANLHSEWQTQANRLVSTYLTSIRRTRIELELNQFLGMYDKIRSAESQLLADISRTNGEEVQELLQIQWFFDFSSTLTRKLFEAMDRSQPAPRIKDHTQESEETVSRALRIGYVGADFREQVMGRMILPVIQNRNRENFKVTCIALNETEDRLTKQFEQLSDNYFRCARASDHDVAELIRAEKIDILVDLSGPTAGSRPGIFARKPAPIIITHVGSAGPLGLYSVDYKLTDNSCDISENQQYLIEKLLPMDGCCYPVPKYPLPTQGLTKADLQLEGKVVIGAFYTYMKLSERCVKLWKRVLDEIPNGVLLFSPLDLKLKVAYENIMRAAGIPAAQFRFIPAGPTEAERLARYRVVDFVLDSMPYGGVNGTLEALYMGVPVVTLLGKHHSERTTTSMLTHLGVPDTVAQTPDEYIAHAKRIATDPAWREDLSSRIRARWPKFADPTDYARRWEALLRKVAR
jgi:protein O-GlcNAc transferase